VCCIRVTSLLFLVLFFTFFTPFFSKHIIYRFSLSTSTFLEAQDVKYLYKPQNVRFQVLMEVSMKITVFWDVVPCNLVEVQRCLQAPLKCQTTSTRLHGATSQKTVIFKPQNLLFNALVWNNPKKVLAMILYMVLFYRTSTVH
jgi:hypothetical protein